MKRYTLKAPEDFYKKMKMESVRTDKNISNYIIEAVNEKISRDEKKK